MRRRERLTAVMLVAVALTTLPAFAGDIPVDVEGRSVTVKATRLNRQITAQDRDAGAQDTALACSFLYYGHLSKAAIQEAATLSTDPKATADKWIRYQDRIGVEEFKKAMSAYFTAKNVVLAELTLGDAVMLVVKTDEYTAGQMYVRQGDKWFWAETLKTDAGKAFGKILSMVHDDKLRF